MAYVLFFRVLHFFHDPMNHNWCLIPCFLKHRLLGSDAMVTWTIIRVWGTHKANASSASCLSRQNSVNGPIIFQRVSAKEVCGGSSAMGWLGQSVFSWKSQFTYSSGQQQMKRGPVPGLTFGGRNRCVATNKQWDGSSSGSLCRADLSHGLKVSSTPFHQL